MSHFAPAYPHRPISTTYARRAGNDPDWGRLKGIICHLYANHELKDVMRIMEVDHRFKASEKLYKTKFAEWGADNKKIKTSEYKSMLKVKRRREQEEPARATKFSIHGQLVPDSKIARWEARMRKQGTITEDDTFSNIGTPPSLAFRTPTPSIASFSPMLGEPIINSPSMEPMAARSSHSPAILSPSLAILRQHELITALSLFPGSVDEFVSMDASTYQLWRAPTPITTSHYSPLSSIIQLSHSPHSLRDAISTSPAQDHVRAAATARLLSGSPDPKMGLQVELPARIPSKYGTLKQSRITDLHPINATSQITPDNEQVSRQSVLLWWSSGISDDVVQPIDCNFDESLSRLVQRINEKARIVPSNESRMLIDDLLNILKHGQRAASNLRPSGTVYGARRATNVSQELIQTMDLLLAATSVAVNDNAVVGSSSSVTKGTIIGQERKRKIIDTSRGTFTVTTNKRRRRHADQHCKDSNPCLDDSEEEFVAKILFKSETPRTIIVVSVSQSQTVHGSVSGIPTLLLNNVIPSNSLIFKLAAEGRAEDLISLVSAGEGNLRDHDPKGRSLLHFAVNNPPVCRFLLRHGLDVDEVANRVADTGDHPFAFGTPLHSAKASESMETIYMLLEADADPTLPCPSWISVLHEVASKNDIMSYEILRGMFRRSSHFGLPAARDHCGRTPLLRACNPSHGERFGRDWFHNSGGNTRSLTLLLINECSVQDVDYNGSTCLHIFSVRPYRLHHTRTGKTL